MEKSVIIVGAGIVGVSIAIHLQQRGQQVVLVDRAAPGRGTSFGNAGLIQKEGVEPYAFPRHPRELLKVIGNRGLAARYDALALGGYMRPLVQYWWHSAPARYRKIVADYAPLIAESVAEHQKLIAAAGAEKIIGHGGYYLLAHDQQSLDAIHTEADNAARYGVDHRKLSGAEIAAIEPGLKQAMTGAVHWTEPLTVNDPAALTEAYLAHFKVLGGQFETGDVQSLKQTGSGWHIDTASGPVSAARAVLALGPWAKAATDRLGYNLPLFIKRGYHMHYAAAPGTLNNWVYPMAASAVLAPMRAGIRITTGAEFAAIDRAATGWQLDAVETVVRDLIPLGDRLDPQPWLGARPCTPDMKPVIGPAPRHPNLWFAFGHAHHGLTLAAVTGRLLAEAMMGETPFIDLTPFRAERFL